MTRFLTSSLMLIFTVGFLTPALNSGAAEWGSLKGRFIVEGDVPKLPPLPVDSKDPFCVQAKPENNSIIVGDKGELEDAVVYVRVPRGKKLENIHPDYAAQLSEPVVLDNHGCSFVPHVTLVRVGQTLIIKKSDPTGHNTNISFLAFNQSIPPDGVSIKVSKESPVPAPVQCNIHPFMKGYILAQDHPYMATSAADGTFEIKNIPAGKHEFQFWHEPRYLKGAKFKGGTANAQGRAELTIAAGQTLDLGDIKVPASVLKP
jgi:hypothetical protein